jgi:hypothetical protein
MTYETRTTAVTVAPKGEPLFSEQATTITITDEAGGEYVEIAQSRDDGEGKVLITSEEWPTIRAAVDAMINDCRDNTK